MSDIAVRVTNLSKRYRIGGQQGSYRKYKTLRESLTERLHRAFRHKKGGGHKYIWALKDINFEVKKGEALGIIGPNGAGKSTLLKILSRITKPTTGKAEVFGRVGSLLEVGTGFHPELTGRENIYLNGAILGMSRAEIDRRFDEIVDFSGVEKFIDTPVKHYSSGMYLRLAFSVAAHLEPEILIIDEVLAVGDAKFQKKCLGKMGKVAKEGRTVIFVSHNMGAIDKLCQSGMVIKHGEVLYIGSQTEAITQYLKRSPDNAISLHGRTDREGSGKLRIIDIEFKDSHGNLIDKAVCGQDINIYLYFKTSPGFRSHKVIASLKFNTHLGVPVFLHHNRLTQDEFGNLPQNGAFLCSLKKLPLPPSTYCVNYSIMDDVGYLDAMRDAIELTVINGDFFGSGEVPPITHGVCLVDGKWRLLHKSNYVP